MKIQQLRASRLGWNILAIAYAGIFLTILILAYTGKLPSILTQNDKLGHVVLYFLATFLGHHVCRYRRIPFAGLTIPLFPLLFGTFTVVEEFLQSLSPNRTFDAIDLVASFVGICLGYWLADRERKRE